MTGLALAIVLPTLEERDNLAPLIERIAAALDPAIGRDVWEAIIVDDNSADGTAEEARRLAAADPRIRVLQRFGRRGLASAAIEGICATAAPHVAVMDADHQHDPTLLPAMLAAVAAGECEVAVASRFVAGGSAAALDDPRQRASRLANGLARRLTGVALSDPMSGYFLLPSATVRRLAPRLSGIGFKLLLDILSAARPPLAVCEFPLQLDERRAGQSKLDEGIALDFLVGIYERVLGRYLPTRFALFATVGAGGMIVHFAVLGVLFRLAGMAFPAAQALSVFLAMSFNFWLNNLLTYRDQRLSGPGRMLSGWASFCAACALGAVANVAVASLLQANGLWWVLAGLAGIGVGAVWNYALSSRFVWGRFG